MALTKIRALAKPLRRFGVPIGGACDEASLTAVSNWGQEPVERLEVQGYEPRAIHITQMQWCVLAGFGHEAVIHRGMNQYRTEPFQPFLCMPGDDISFHEVLFGVPSYWVTFGCHRPNPTGKTPIRNTEAPIRVVAHQAEDLWTAQTWKVSHQRDRRGIRLVGQALPPLVETASRPIPIGTIQLPANGQPIIVGPDGPTIGGYPVLGVVCEADLSAIQRIAIGETVRFSPISIEEALALTYS